MAQPDTSIYRGFQLPQIQDPLEQQQRFMTLKGAMEQQQAAEVERQRQATEAQRQEAYRSEVAGLGPQPSEEDLTRVATRYAPPQELMKSLVASRDRQAQIAATAEQRKAALAQQAQQLEFMREFKLSQARTAEEKAKVDADFKQQMFDLRKQMQDNAPQQPVTLARIVDPTKPDQMIEVDARTYKGGGVGSPGVIGISGRESAAQTRVAGQQFKMRGLGAAIQKAEDILMGVTRNEAGDVTGTASTPTASGFGSLVDAGLGFVGVSTPGADKAADMRVIAGRLISKVPRMEGPQSDKDVELYKKMAGDAGNEKLPVSQRISAVRTMKELYAKYEHLNKEDGSVPPGQPTPAPAPGLPSADAIKAELERRRRERGGR